ncbi:hypothetical protein bcCo53_001208 (plasmid) [Borrelia coriaceae]|uniref:Uncharacterized protein n=1 Tax=Borrelia coriaceae ATCC 43381 TaxID=1408429 RepID=W5SWL3_9SPIR|nr:hypothetical protein [Borrelia coriaceae]AHH11083.1 hypothetical protein BCO_0000400 [Borrelia coriaceae ATCC 43381]UPA17039.1 hypothetical protein bcCo53_001208 [Borrelia coriaceae]
MLDRKLFLKLLKLLFVVSLFIFFNSCTKESQDLRVSYHSNKPDEGGIMTLSLTNSDNLFEINYHFSSNLCGLHLMLKNDSDITIKNVKLKEDDICMYDSITDEKLLNRSDDEKWHAYYDVDFDSCKAKWKELIEGAKGGDLKFSVIASEVESGHEKTYEFRVSEANMRQLVALIEQTLVERISSILQQQ